MGAPGKIADMEVRVDESDAGKRITIEPGGRTILAALRAVQVQGAATQAM
jgi:predicted RNA-binding protein YlqC (UPF0109 family)